MESIQTDVVTAKNNGISAILLSMSGQVLTGRITKQNGTSVSSATTIPSGKKSLYSGSLDNLITYVEDTSSSTNKLTVKQEFMIEYIYYDDYTVHTTTVIVPSGSYTDFNYDAIGETSMLIDNYPISCYIKLTEFSLTVYVCGDIGEQISTSSISKSQNTQDGYYRLFT